MNEMKDTFLQPVIVVTNNPTGTKLDNAIKRFKLATAILGTTYMAVLLYSAVKSFVAKRKVVVCTKETKESEEKQGE